MKILYLANEVIYPTNSGGRTRAYHLVKALSSVHRVGVAYISAEDMPADIGLNCDYAQKIKLSQPFDLSAFSRGYAIKLLILSLLKRSFPITEHWMGARQIQAITDLVAKESPEVIIIQASYLLPMAKLLKKRFPDIAYVLDAHNVESQLHRRMAQSKPQPIRLLFSVLATNLATMERRAGLTVKAIAAVSDQDAEWFKKGSPATEISVVPNGVNLDFFMTDKSLPADPILAFSGLMSYRPNSEGALWFANHVWPGVLAGQPEAQWLIIGRDPSDEVRELASDKQVTVTGTVDDVRVWLEKSRLVVVPLLSGGGTRLKILEAMAMQRVIVSTSIGAEGILETPGLIRVDDPDKMAEIIIDLLGSKELLSLAQSNRQFVEQHYGWDQIGQRMLELVKKAVIDG